MRTWRDPEEFVRETGFRDPEVDELILNRLSRRSLLRYAALGAAGTGAAAFLAACGGGDKSDDKAAGQATISAQPRQQESAEPRRGGQLVVAQIAAHDDLDPHVTLTAVGHQVYFNLVNTLV